jgi:1-phosphofructokinase family hexose kinase
VITCLGLSPALDVTYLVDRVGVGEIHRPRTVLTLPGGKALNAARAIVALGGRARAIVPLGGFAGARLRAELEPLGLDVAAIATDRETRSCVTVYDDAGTTTEFYEATPELGDAAWAEVLAAVGAVDGGWLAVSGSLPEARATSLALALGDAGRRGVSVAVDTHGAALREILARARPALVKVNRSEAAALLALGSDGAGAGSPDVESLARAIGERGAGIAIVTDGAAGAVATHGAAVWRCAPPETGRYAVGSGDCFLAGLLVAFDGSGTADVTAAQVPGALGLATAAAAANTRVPGAAVFSPDVVRELRAAVTVDGGTRV